MWRHETVGESEEENHHKGIGHRLLRGKAGQGEGLAIPNKTGSRSGGGGWECAYVGSESWRIEEIIRSLLLTKGETRSEQRARGSGKIEKARHATKPIH